MPDIIKSISKTFVEHFDTEPRYFRNETTFIIKPEQIIRVCTTLKDEFKFEILTAQTAVDYWPQINPRFHVVYHIYSITHNLRISLRVPLEGNSPSMPTIESVYPNANWYEREIWDMFGINFENHSDLRRILMPHDWEGHPLRKDYPLGYEEVQFTFNFDEIDLRKPYAKS